MLSRLCQLFCVLALFLSSSVTAADFEVFEFAGGQPSLRISGQIRKGDFDRFQRFLVSSKALNAFRKRVILDSTGGDVGEALKLATLIERSYATVMVYGKCYSACFILYAAGADRSLFMGSVLGLHRVSLSAAESDIGKAKNLVAPASDVVSNYLQKQGIPRSIIDKMNETSASDIVLLDKDDIVKAGFSKIMKYNSTYIDVVEKSCGRYPYDSFGSIPADDLMRGKVWIDCEFDIQVKNKDAFILAEIDRLKKGQATVLFPKGSWREFSREFNL